MAASRNKNKLILKFKNEVLTHILVKYLIIRTTLVSLCIHVGIYMSKRHRGILSKASIY